MSSATWTRTWRAPTTASRFVMVVEMVREIRYVCWYVSLRLQCLQGPVNGPCLVLIATSRLRAQGRLTGYKG